MTVIECNFEFEPAEPDAGLREGWVADATIYDTGIEHHFAVVPNEMAPVEEWDIFSACSVLVRGEERIPTLSLYEHVETVGQVPEIVPSLRRNWDTIQRLEKEESDKLNAMLEEAEREREIALRQQDERDYLDSLEFDQGL